MAGWRAAQLDTNKLPINRTRERYVIDDEDDGGDGGGDDDDVYDDVL